MTARCELKWAVIDCLHKLGRASSTDVSRLRGVSQENASMTLLKRKRQGLVDRAEFRRGRVHGYLYWMLKKGEERLAYYRRGRGRCGTVDVKRVTENARDRVERVPPIF